MAERLLAGLLCCILLGCGSSGEDATGPTATSVDEYESIPGFVDLFWNRDGGRLYLKVEALDVPFIYQVSLPRGIGSNDLGLDRGQLGSTRVVRFLRSGPRVLLVEDNLDYRANSVDSDEKRAVEESFARSVHWGFDIASEAGGALLVDATDFFLRDAHGLAAALAAADEGSYSVDTGRSAVYMPRTRGFPDNTEVEAIVTFTGEPVGPHLPTVVPDATAVSVHVHHSFIRLPDDGYEPLVFDPRSGMIPLEYDGRGYIDYASPIGHDMYVNFGRRHRLEKQDPAAELSAPVEPIVYYLDRGAPEPVRTALLEGASWWNQAFEAAGYADAFRVEMLPADVDPMDVRYNVIQWVHRSTRGWSYGASVLDPRTGEILKGHVTLGSLRVRQDYLIAEGLLAPYTDENVPGEMLEMALARIRQLSAHEVGHTLGFAHNFAASTQNRASVMDYPAPLVRFDANGGLDLSEAYDTGIGAWDVRTVVYAYQDFEDGVDRQAAREGIMAETIAAGHRFVADEDARDVGTLHPHGSLWDNGADPIDELEHLLEVRAHALARFSESNIRIGRPQATLEEVLVPVYLLHRFQLHAVGKLVGGAYFDYAMRGDEQSLPAPVDAARQRQALAALIATLDTDLLRLPDGLAERIPPRPPGVPKSRETFEAKTGGAFDPLAPARSAATLTIEVLLDPARAARMQRQAEPSFRELVDALLRATWFPSARVASGTDALQLQTNLLVLDGLLRLAVNEAADHGVRAIALDALVQIEREAARPAPADRELAAHLLLAGRRIARGLADPASVEALLPPTVPPGSPIGSVSAAGGSWTD